MYNNYVGLIILQYHPCKSIPMPYKLPFVFCFLLFISGAFAQSNPPVQSAPSPTSYSQSQEQSAQASNRPVQTYPRYWSFGGSLGLSFWNDGTDILIAPKAYYHWSPMFLTGFGVTYIYSDFDDKIFGYHQNSFGGSVMAAVRPIPHRPNRLF